MERSGKGRRKRTKEASIGSRLKKEKPLDHVLGDLGPLNRELSECLKRAIQGKENPFVFLTSENKHINVILENPAMIPSYMLFAISQKLGVMAEIYAILISYED